MGEPLENSGGRGNSTPALSTTLLDDPKRIRGDVRLLGRALREGWGITPDMKQSLPRKMMEIVEKDTITVMSATGEPVEVDNVRAQVAAAGVLVKMEAQNQGDDHLAIQNDRLDAGKPTMNVGRAVPTLEDAVARLLAQSIPIEAWPPMVRAFHVKKVEAKVVG